MRQLKRSAADDRKLSHASLKMVRVSALFLTISFSEQYVYQNMARSYENRDDKGSVTGKSGKLSNIQEIPSIRLHDGSHPTV